LPVSYAGIRFLKTNQPTQKPPKEFAVPEYRPPALGVNPAYDEALKYISEDKESKYRQIKEIETKIKQILQNGYPITDKTVSELEKEKHILEIRAEANDPEVRWNFEHGKIDMSKPVYRFLQEKKWKNGYLQHLMERVSQMYVVPDVFPELVDPTIDLQFRYGDEVGEPGAFQLPINTINPPTVILDNFHVDNRLYTLVMVNPDMPDVEQKAFQMEWHWLIVNIPLKATKTDISGGETIVSYIPPHPPKGTKYHRYALGIYEQPYGRINVDDINQYKTTHDFAEKYRLKLRGASFFREIWDKNVSEIYNNILKIREPIYGKQPNLDIRKNEFTKYPESLNDN
ncbi:18112_t:CDS:2, partial [Acaulospora morrowiae]